MTGEKMCLGNNHFRKSRIAVLVFKVEGCFGSAQNTRVFFNFFGNEQNFLSNICQNPAQVKSIIDNLLHHFNYLFSFVSGFCVPLFSEIIISGVAGGIGT